MRDAIGGYDLKIPESGDKGAPVFKALEDAIDRLSIHSHNSLNSVPINSYDLNKSEPIQIALSDWSPMPLGNGWKKEGIVCPDQHLLSKSIITFREINTNKIIYPTIYPESDRIFTVVVGRQVQLEISFT